MKTRLGIVVLILFLLLSACSTTKADMPIEIEGFAQHLVFSEITAGKTGNNLYDYIEIYNPTNEILDLKGLSIWYQLKDDSDQVRLVIWDQETLIPPFGYYLMGYQGQDFGLTPDGIFSQPLVGARGGLTLKQGNQVIDQVVWGAGPVGLTEGNPAPKFDLDTSLERLPGNSQGNGIDTDNNAVDFAVADQFLPQNSGSQSQPIAAEDLSITLEVPDEVLPGSEFSYSLRVENISEGTLEGIQVFVPVSEQLTLLNTNQEFTVEDRVGVFSVSSLESQSSTNLTIDFRAPWTYGEVFVPNTYGVAKNSASPVFAGPQLFSIGGGGIPIETARGLLGLEVVVQGTATMYPDGLYAGSGAKFYLQDESGGIQVYVAQAANALTIPVGSLVQVRGRINLYRGSLQVIPSSAAQVEVLEGDLEELVPDPVGIHQVANDKESLPGLLVQVEGQIARVEEMTYSYEIDLVDQDGNLATCYIDKLTNISVDAINSGDQYKITGIVEAQDDFQRLYPRLQTDFIQIFPPELFVDVDAPIAVERGDTFVVTYHVINHTPETLTNLTVTALLPDQLDLVSLDQSGSGSGQEISFDANELAGNGESFSFSAEVITSSESEFVTFEVFQATADQWATPVTGPPTYTFFGDQVPIWAIQGPGSKTPYLMKNLTTQGIVTGVFPDLQGFWIQEMSTDNQEATSAGIFIDHGVLTFDVQTGELVEVTGYALEANQQTQIEVKSAKGVTVLSSGNKLPVPVHLDPPELVADAQVYLEQLEGMLVEISDHAVAVGPTNRYGEFAIVLPDHQTTRIFRGDQEGIVIRVDDGSTDVHDSQKTIDTPVGVGDQVYDLTGPLAFTYGQFKIEPIADFRVVSSTVELQAEELLREDQFSMMTWNVENLFDFSLPNPTSPPMPNVREYKLAIKKVANTILYAGAPTLVGLQEVENIEILEDVAADEALADFGYIPILIEGDDSRGIDVAYLLRGDQADLIRVDQYPAPEGLTSRPPLQVEVSLGDHLVFYALNNHFISMSGGEVATEPRRTAQAAWNVELIEEIFSSKPEALVAVMGDLNSYHDSLPIDTLRAAGLHNVLDLVPEEERYTYNYQGISQVIDHILVSDALFELIEEVFIFHGNADYPIPAEGDASPLHKSDHDPVIVIFSFP